MNYEVYYEDGCLCIKIDDEVAYTEVMDWIEYKKILPYFQQENK